MMGLGVAILTAVYEELKTFFIDWCVVIGES